MSKTATKAAIKRIVHSAKKNQEAKPKMHGYWEEDGAMVVMDNYQALWLTTPIECDVNKVEGIPGLLPKLFKEAENGKPLNLPTIDEIKAFRKTCPKDSQGRQKYDFGEDQPMVNAEYLLNMLEGLDNCKATYTNIHKQVYFYGDNGRGLVMPVRKG